MEKINYLVDTHAHLDMPPLNGEIDRALDRARATQVRQVITVGVDLGSSKEAARIAARHESVFAAIGIHPHDAHVAQQDDFKRLARMASLQKVVAWGEIGLDFFKEYSPPDIQRRVFERQLGLAIEVGLPVIIHDRDAHDAVVEMLRGYARHGLKGVFHCFSGGIDLARQVLDLGLYISITGVITFPNSRQLQDVVKYVPIERLLVETDSPFLSPVPFRGKPNEPARTAIVAKAISSLKNLSIQEVACWTTANARALFGLPRI